MSRTGLSPADIAESFRDRCGDGSLEWTYMPMQTWVLLDAADMLDENERLLKDRNEWFQAFSKQEQKCFDLVAENAKLREFAKEACEMARSFYNLGGTFNDLDDLLCEASELGVVVDA